MEEFNNYFSLCCMVFASFLLGFRATISHSGLLDRELLKPITYLTFFLFLVSTMLNKYTIKHMFLAIFYLGIGLAVLLFSKRDTVLYNMILILSARKMNLKKLIKANFIGSALACSLIIFCEEIGIIPDQIMVYGGESLRSLGFGNPNTFPSTFCMLVFMYVYTDYEHIRIPHLILFSSVVTILYKITGCRTALLLIWMLCVIILLYKTCPKLRNFSLQFYFPAAMAIAFIGIFGMILINIIPLFMKLNNLLSGRLIQPSFYYLKYGIHPFGIFIDELQSSNVKWRANVIDNGYALVLLNYGIVYFWIFFTTFWKTIIVKTKEKDYRTLLSLIFVLIILLAENYACSFLYNSLMILCVEAYYPNKIKRKGHCV